MREEQWTRHSDGWTCGNVGVFPLTATDVWEVWECIDGEWQPRRPRIWEKTIDDAKAKALAIAAL